MKFQIYQIVVPLIAMFFIARVIYFFLKRKRNIFSTIIWIVFWTTVGALAILPDPISVKIAEILGFASNVNAVIFVALGLLFLFIFYLTSTVDRLESQLANLARNIALKDEQKKKSKTRNKAKPKR